MQHVFLKRNSQEKKGRTIFLRYGALTVLPLLMGGRRDSGKLSGKTNVFPSYTVKVETLSVPWEKKLQKIFYQKIITGLPINIIVSGNDGMTLGFLEVLHNHGIKTGKNITIVTVDAQQEAIDKLKAGEINCVIECNPNIGPQVMELVKKLAANEPIPKLTDVKESVFTENDDLSNLPPRGY